MSYGRIKSLVGEELKSYFRPEFLNRLDEIIVFRQLTKKEVKQIADIFLKVARSRGCLCASWAGLGWRATAWCSMSQTSGDPQQVQRRHLMSACMQDTSLALSKQLALADS
jgi:hypothetical protein